MTDSKHKNFVDGLFQTVREMATEMGEGIFYEPGNAGFWDNWSPGIGFSIPGGPFFYRDTKDIENIEASWEFHCREYPEERLPAFDALGELQALIDGSPVLKKFFAAKSDEAAMKFLRPKWEPKTEEEKRRHAREWRLNGALAEAAIQARYFLTRENPTPEELIQAGVYLERLRLLLNAGSFAAKGRAFVKKQGTKHRDDNSLRVEFIESVERAWKRYQIESKKEGLRPTALGFAGGEDSWLADNGEFEGIEFVKGRFAYDDFAVLPDTLRRWIRGGNLKK
jgi:hypothetical protein